MVTMRQAVDRYVETLRATGRAQDAVSSTERSLRRFLRFAGDSVIFEPVSLRRSTEAEREGLERLTPRQMEVLHLMAMAYSNAGISRALVLGEQSVHGCINAIFGELVSERDGSINPRVRAAMIYVEATGGYCKTT